MAFIYNPLKNLALQIVTNGGGGGGGTSFAWNFVSGTTTTAADNNGYVCQNAGLTTVQLPTTAASGTVIEVIASTSGGFSIAQNAGQSIKFGLDSTTLGAAGSLKSTAVNDTVRILCTTADTTWTVLSSVGNLNLV